MARLTLNKSVLHKENNKLKTYKKFLPALDLKRRQLLVEQKKNERILSQRRQNYEELLTIVNRQLPMLAAQEFRLDALVSVKAVEQQTENLVGVELPVFKAVTFHPVHYPLLGKPHWVDYLVDLLQRGAELTIRIDLDQRRQDILDRAVKKITQRVNLFDKVLIPETQQNIRKIKIYLSDMERASVVRAKTAKSRKPG